MRKKQMIRIQTLSWRRAKITGNRVTTANQISPEVNIQKLNVHVQIYRKLPRYFLVQLSGSSSIMATKSFLCILAAFDAIALCAKPFSQVFGDILKQFLCFPYGRMLKGNLHTYSVCVCVCLPPPCLLSFSFVFPCSSWKLALSCVYPF